ncbi:ENR1 protein, partial [Pluvianellus socialis]|nr:ENR1 protein [Pluvianellus socialis]
METELEFPTFGQNLFVGLATKIVEGLNITNCCVCGGPLMADQWPWKGTALGAFEIIRWNHNFTNSGVRWSGGWVLSAVVIGVDCLRRDG